jgi:phosphatidylinositol alpha-1,6-mannosyltransferase
MQKTLLITTDYPPRIGGVSEYLAQICKRLPASEITVLTTTDDNSAEFDLKQKYMVIRKKFYYKSLLVWPKWLRLMLVVFRTVRRSDYKQILVGQILPVGTVALIINYLLGIPYIVSTHAMDITILSSSPRKTWLAKKILAKSEQVVTVSHYTKSKIIDLGVVENKVVIISPATDIQHHAITDRKNDFLAKYNLNGKNVLLTVGRLVERKGHLEVMKALPDIIRSFPQIVYLITSDGPYKKQLEKYVRENDLEQHVVFTGTIKRDDLPSLYQISDVFIMPTRILADNDVEGFGIVYLEANAFGKPVIAYNSGGVSDAVLHKKTGLLVEPKKPAEIAKAVVHLLKDTEYANLLGEQGRSRVLNEFTWDVKADMFRGIL